MTKNPKLLIRKTHRYLGVAIGIQFIFWTVSGLYFSWNDIDEVHGDHLRKVPRQLSLDQDLISPKVAVDSLSKVRRIDSVHSVTLIRILDKPIYQIKYFSGHAGEGSHLHLHHALSDAITGITRPEINEDEAKAIAQENVAGSPSIVQIEYLKTIGGHHEYRDKPLPAWAVHFDNPKSTVYISSQLGTFQTIRHDTWRIFDFLWMTHIMDYETRDDIGNWLLRIFSIFGVLTVFSGFTLYFTSRSSMK